MVKAPYVKPRKALIKILYAPHIISYEELPILWAGILRYMILYDTTVVSRTWDDDMLVLLEAPYSNPSSHARSPRPSAGIGCSCCST